MRVKNYSISSLQLRGDTFLMIQFCGITTLRISCTRPDVELINNERRAKKPERWQDQARRVRLMRGLAGCLIFYKVYNFLKLLFKSCFLVVSNCIAVMNDLEKKYKFYFVLLL